MKWLLIGISIALLAVGLSQPRGSGGAAVETPAGSNSLAAIERGRALVILGDCKACHTARGGKDYAGGRAIPTPFGTFYSPNITPDPETGIGLWTAEDFWHALHDGYARGRLLYPTFPYTNYTKISRPDALAMFDYLRTIKPVRQPARAHELEFPYDQHLLLRVWRGLFFRAGVYEADPTQTAEWNRGAYLVEGLAHCSACHESRNSLGATRSGQDRGGGLALGWYAPSLTREDEAGMRHWRVDEIVSFLKYGRTPESSVISVHASAMGPMAEVVYESLQHVSPEDLRAMAVYLKSLPETGTIAPNPGLRPPPGELPSILQRGRTIYTDRCAHCHGEHGEGKAPVAPPLAGNRAVTMASDINPIRIVLYGGYPPGTTGNARPFGMPPFANVLSDQDIADVLSYTRKAWGNDGNAVVASDIARSRTGPLW